MHFTSEELAILQYQQDGPPAAPEPQDGFVITRTWLNTHQGSSGRFKARQLAAIGVEWPPRPGWLAKVEGTLITQAKRLIFESYLR
jgi:hypothetical protein